MSDVRDNPQRSRYEITIDGEQAGFVDYTQRGDVVTFTHTEVETELRRRGLAGQLVGAALDDMRSRGLKVVAECPFVQSYIDQHPEYSDLLAA